MPQHPVVSREAWLNARIALLAKEKELTRLQDALNAERQRQPWVRIGKDYVFETPDGPRSLADLFDGRSQLCVYHFMLGPGWQAGCVGCSFLADHIDGANRHLMHHDLTVVAVSRATLPEIAAYRQRMGWQFPWVSSSGSDFNFDFGVSFTPDQIASGTAVYNYREMPRGSEEQPGVSMFAKDETGAVFHTYSSYGRGNEYLIGAYAYLDIAPKGRNETGPGGNLGDWVRRHDEYTAPSPAACCAD